MRWTWTLCMNVLSSWDGNLAHDGVQHDVVISSVEDA